MPFCLFGQLLFKSSNFNCLNKTFTRFRRIQTRQPLAVYKDFNEAAEKLTLKEELKEKRKKIPFEQSSEFYKQQQQQQQEETLQKEANRVYYKHDPYSQNDNLTKDIVDDITQNVDFLAAKLTNKNETLDKIMKLPDGDHRFGPVVQIAKSLRHRYEKKKILLDGKRLIIDALDSGVKIETIFLSKETLLKDFDFDFSKLDYKINFYQVTPRSMNVWSDVQTAQGFMAIAKMPAPGDCKINRTLDLPFTLILDQIKDPGNMGTLIRTAAAVGCTKILVSKTSVDIWETKVIRSGMGGHFRIPILHNLTYEQIDTYLPTNTKLLYADSSKLETNEINIKKLDYTQLDQIVQNKDHVALVIGNEATGLTKDIFDLGSYKTSNSNRAIINIPLDNGVESLNCGVAFSILGYEIRKLLLSK